MPALHPRFRVLAVGVSAFALVAVAAGGTFAASNPSTLYACYDPYGNVRMGDTAQCKLPGGGRLVSWGTVGPMGPTGATGAAGPTGPTGPTGATGTGVTATRYVIPSGIGQRVFEDGAHRMDLGCSGAGAPIGSGVPVFYAYPGGVLDYSGGATVAFPADFSTGYPLTSAPKAVTITLDDGTNALVFYVVAETGGDTCTFVVQH